MPCTAGNLFALDFSSVGNPTVTWMLGGDAQTEAFFNPVYANGRVYAIQKEGPESQGGYVLTAATASTGAKAFNVSIEFYAPAFPLAITPSGAVLAYGPFNHMSSGVVRPSTFWVVPMRKLDPPPRSRLSVKKRSCCNAHCNSIMMFGLLLVRQVTS